MSSLVLSQVLQQRAARDISSVSSCKTVEIGAGLGLTSLMAWRLGYSQVTATDGDDAVVSLIGINAAAVHLESDHGQDWDGDVSSLPFRVDRYSYGENPAFLGGPFDLVLCSDLIYLKICDDMIRAIVSSCSQLTRSGGEVLMAHAIRLASVEQLERFIQWMVEEGFTHSALAYGDECPEIAHKCVEMHSFIRK